MALTDSAPLHSLRVCERLALRSRRRLVHFPLPFPMTDSDRREAARDEVIVEREREFVDAEGTRWRVKETSFSHYDRRRGRSLIFWSDGAVRRVRSYPADWYELSENELVQLSWNI